ncbi:alpha/beta fold hydrolase [Propionivibrio sp.]|uniref:alpha/beta hydrolase n=1 Tax=Propionivibrio sp. TaxID=2212460 RepID=UPI0025D397EA|nr:alpha/beta fold hydrolase [Propionivibrio sp.]MBK7355110.1 alpha/beta fold hydrolase [Propionivibrio sp.]MBK8402476.1 alpha/beta fold hydrolase [Propionivibrio sp.]MBK8743633.1 alpha/beta fold hydrolase [Propionivibrio sp.]MBK8893347.1 alpha/beta fold hydrolase [Propionivibrio sp.]
MHRQLHTLDRLASEEKGYPPLVFVHGGYTHSACWDVNFLPYFQALGFNCYAVDLSGHGKSAGRDKLNSFGLDHYADDVGHLVAGLDADPVLIGHSMGAVVVQRYLEKAPAKAVVMMAPVPPTGLAASGMQLALRQPEFVAEAERAVRGEYTANTVRVMREVYFSPDATMEHFAQFQPMVQDESMLVLTEMMTLAMRLPRRRPRIPALVIGGQLDMLFAANRLHFTATGWNADTCVIPRAGHMLMIDPQWVSVAEKIHAWLGVKLGLPGHGTRRVPATLAA